MARILVVDDNDQVRGAARRILARDGHEVWDVPGGPEALGLLGVLRVDLVLTDVCMPGMTGLELMAQLHSEGHRMPVIVVTGGGLAPLDELLALARACGADVALAKPFSPCELRDAVASALGSAAAVA